LGRSARSQEGRVDGPDEVIRHESMLNGRIRMIGAVLALLALSTYFVEGLWASTCESRMVAGSGVEAPGILEHDGGHIHGLPDRSGDDTAPGKPICPLGVAGPGSSCVSLSLPSAGATVLTELDTYTSALHLPSRVPALLLSLDQFRPPR
jgi:hypothetical protein